MPDPKFLGSVHAAPPNYGMAVDASLAAKRLDVEEIAETLGLQTEMGKAFLKASLDNVQLFDRKQRDYGSGNISAFGEFGVLVRLSDKLARLRNLLAKGGPAAVSEEALEDTWKDVANYGLIGFLVRKGLWK